MTDTHTPTQAEIEALVNDLHEMASSQEDLAPYDCYDDSDLLRSAATALTAMQAERDAAVARAEAAAREQVLTQAQVDRLLGLTNKLDDDLQECRKYATALEQELKDRAEAAEKLVSATPNLMMFAQSWARFVDATFAPVNSDAAMREVGDDSVITLTVGQFREFYEAAQAALSTDAKGV